MDGLRVRLVFQDRHMLSKPQKSEGLKRSWLFLRPEHQTVSDLSSHLLHAFDLHHSCPNGVLLSMDGFVLPSFESTSILKDKDVICVQKKKNKQSEIVLRDNVNPLEDADIVEKQPVCNGVLLLANEEFEKESGGYQSEPEEDEEADDSEEKPHTTVSKKRKASGKLESKKSKKQRSVVPENVLNDNHKEQIELKQVLPKKKHRKEDVPKKSKHNKASTPESDETSDDDSVESMPGVKSNQIQENGKGSEDVTPRPESNKKLPSRSARRKKAKRKWLREMAKIGKKDVDHSNELLNWKKDSAKAKKEELNWKKGSDRGKKEEVANHKKGSGRGKKEEVANHSKGLLQWKSSAEKDVHKDDVENEKRGQKSVAEDDVAPIVIRPGHIRFEPLEDDQAVHQSDMSVWNGITSKKKGQKWGTERLPSSRKNDYKVPVKESSEPSNTVNKEIITNDPIDFPKLPPLTGLPEEDDVIAYCLVELSSFCTPELSSFRVGKVSWYNPQSRKIKLLPVPEYPIISSKSDEDTSAQQIGDSPYGEDGSLEADFSSLIDIRVVSRSNSDATKSVAGGSWETPNKQTHASTNENGVNPWDQLSQALSAKKEELSQVKAWTKEGGSGRNPWSYRALRGSALGPTMALLRSKKAI